MERGIILLCLLSFMSFSEGINFNRYQREWKGDSPWLNIHPAFGHSQDQQTKLPENHERNTNMVWIARKYIQKHPKVKQFVYNLMSKYQLTIDGGDQYMSANPWTCPDPGPTICDPQPTTESLTSQAPPRTDLPEMWNHVVELLENDPEDCQPCIETWTMLQNLACSGVTWEQIAEPMIAACEIIFNLDGRDPVMCNGTINLQGQHIYCLLLEADPRDICESVNNCYPPDNRIRPPVSERTPWAVKAALESEGYQLKSTEKSQKKPNRDDLVMIAQLSDIHVQHLHSVGSPVDCGGYVCCLEDSIGTGEARPYGEYTCNLPPRTLELFLNRVRDAKPDFIIYAGDSPPHTQWDETMESQLNCSQIIADAMHRKFGDNMRVYPNIGNHEMYPTNLYSLRMPETKTMNARFVEMWHKLADLDTSANSSMAKLSDYTRLVPDQNRKLRILSMNTNYDWYKMNFYNTLNQHTSENEDHKTWVEDTLGAAQTAGEKVIVIGHHPVNGDAHIRASRWWEEVTKEYGDTILLHVSGHTHKDEFALSFNPDTMNATSVNLVSASTTSNTFINPSMRVFYLDPNNDYQLVDMESFYLEIKTQEQSIGVPPSIAFSYSAKTLYGMPDLSPNSWKDLVLRFIDDNDLFLTYYRHRFSMSDPDRACDYACKVQEICGIWFPEESEAAECTTLAPPEPTTTPSPTTTTTSPVLAATSLSYSGFILVSLVMLVKLLEG